MYEFCFDYIKPKYQDNVNLCNPNLCYTDTDSLFIQIKNEDFNKNITNEVERLFDTSNYDGNDERLLPTGKNKN